MALLPRSDSWAVRRVLAGHPEAFEVLVLRYQRKAFAVAQSVGTPRSGLEDVVQESLLQSFRDLSSLKEPSRFGPWFLQIVRNTACRLLRRSLATTHRPLSESTRAPPGEPIEDKDLGTYLRGKVQELPGGIREAVFLYYYEGGDVAQVARSLSISRAAARKRLQRGREILRSELWKELEETLRDMLPSTREWKLKGRALTLIILASIPFSLRARAASASLPAVAGAAAPAALGGGAFSGKGTLLALCLLAALVTTGTATVAHRMTRQGRRPAEVAGPPPAEQAVDAGKVVQVLAKDRAEPPSPLRLRVEDQDGRLVEHAVVSVSWKVTTRRGGAPPAGGSAARRSADGEFLWPDPPGDSALFTVGAAGFIPKMEEHAIPEGGLPAPIVVVLEKGPVFSGRLVDGRTLDPVPGARVGLLASGFFPARPPRHVSGLPPRGLDALSPVNLLYEVESDAGGRFQLTGLPGTVWASREGYGPTALVASADWADFADEVAVVPMFPPTTLRIAVRSEDGEERSGFTYAVAERAQELPAPPLPRSVEGSEVVHTLYHLCRLRDGQAAPMEEVALAVASGESSLRTTLRLDHGKENRIEAVLGSRGVTFHGRVLTPEGRPARGTRVILAASDSRLILGDLSEIQGAGLATSDASGDYELSSGGRPPPFLIVAEPPSGPVFIGDPIDMPFDRRARHDIQLLPGARILVRTEARPEGKVVLRSHPGSDHRPVLEYRRSIEIDEGGRGEIDQVPPGIWELSREDPRSHALHRALVSVLPGGDYEVPLLKQASGDAVEVRGVLRARGEPIEGQQVWLQSLDSGIEQAMSDQDGQFAFAGVRPGTHALILFPAMGKARFRMRSASLSVTPGMEPLSLDVTTTTLKGRVSSREGPLDLAEVKAYEQTFVEGETRWQCLQTARTSPDGSFRLARLYQAPLVLLFRKQGFQSRWLDWQPRGEVEAMLPEVMLETGSGRADAIRLRVISPDGADVPSVLMELYHAGREVPFLLERLSRSHPDEPLEARGLPAARYRALVSARSPPGWRSAVEVVEFEHQGDSDQEITIPQELRGSARIELLSEDGLLPRRADLEVIDGAGRTVVFVGNRTRLRLDGCAALSGLPLGDLEARVTAQGHGPVRAPFKVEPGRVVRVQVKLARR